ncbi:uncharacterized protein LOC135237339 [Anguilla rostrata]|uniref:uncharacterized protein LOC135237339 n=1 Tax=Anguilla rostrata TaxID=7938 RepID=UPI0030CB10AA
MFKGMHSDGLYRKENAAPAADPGLSVTTLRHANQDSPWIGILSVVSRPALAFLQKYFPGSPTTPNGVSGWQDGDIKRRFKGKNAFLDQPDLIPEAERDLAYHLHYQSGTNGICSSSTAAVSWLSADSLRELGINDSADIDVNMRQQTSAVGYLASVKNVISHVLVNKVSGQDVTVKNPEYHRGLARDDWPSDPVSVASRAKSNWLWDGIWGSADSSQGWLSSFLWRACSVASDQHCPEIDSGIHCQRAESGTTAGVAKPTDLFEQRDYGEPIHGESAGPSSNKGEPDNGSRQSVRPESLPSSEKTLLVCQPVCERLTGIRAATACSEVAVLTPDQDNGYSSLEEEHSNFRMHLVEPACPEQARSGPGEGAEELALPAEGRTSVEAGAGELSDVEATSAGREGEEASGESDLSDLSDTDEEAEPEVLTPPHPQVPGCQNKAIAYIMGSPCSEGSESELEEDSDWDSQDDDDGFDSEGSSDFCDSDDEEEEEEEDAEDGESDAEEADGEVEQLWNSLCRSGDPYDPRNFTAALRTTPARGVAQGEEEEEEVPEEGPCSLRPLPPEEESWEEASDVDEAESLRLWTSFSCAADPYSPLNFRGPLRTRDESRGPGKRPAPPARPAPPSPFLSPDAEDRMDSGFSEAMVLPVQPAPCSAKLKKVRFVEEVEVFYASGDEDRRGPWEEFARDRCRFFRRVQETEHAIGYCLAPPFRLSIFNRLYPSC